MTHKLSSIDLSIFDNKQNNEAEYTDYNNNQCTFDALHCNPVQRLVTALRYYEIINNHTGKNHDDTETRLNWIIGSKVSIYLRSKNEWFDGRISDIFIEQRKNKEWFYVKYQD